MNLRIGTKLIVGFLSIALLLAVVSVISFLQISKMEIPLTRDIPKGLEEIEKTARLDSLAQRIRYFDQVLTESARNYTTTGERKWKYRYKNTEPQLDAAITEAIQKGDEEDKRTFSGVQKSKLAFANIEHQAIEAVDGGERASALALLEDFNYWKIKDDYKKGLEDYVERRGKKYNETLEVNTTKVNTTVQEAYERVRGSARLLLNVTFFSILLAVVLGIAVSRSIVRPIKRLQKGAGIIGKGDLNHRIDVDSKDEVGQLADAFNEMTNKLKESYTVLEDKVRDRTNELAKKVEEDEAILTSIGEGMIATDQAGKIIRANSQATIMFGWPLAEVIGCPVFKPIPVEDEREKEISEARHPIALALRMQREVAMTVYFVRKDKSKFPGIITVSPIILDRKTIGAIAIIRDITKEKEIDQMKTEFVSTVSHELRTPLAIIKEFVSLVLDGIAGETTEKQKHFLTTAKNNIDRLSRIINDLLDISKIEAGKIVLNRILLDPKGLVEEIIQNYKGHFEGKKITIESQIDKGTEKIYADRDKLIQVLTNLIGNAAKFTPEDGRVTIAITRHEKEVEFSVTDTGIGISAENLKKVFGKFEQFGRTAGSGAKGTGLGLAISKGFVELHGGKIWLKSEYGKGTTFAFTIPYLEMDVVYESELKQRLKDSQRKNQPLSVIKVWPTVNGEPSKMQDETMNHLTELLRNALPKTTDLLLRCDGGRAIAAIVECDEMGAQTVEKRIKKEIDKTKIVSAYTTQLFSSETQPIDEFLLALTAKRAV